MLDPSLGPLAPVLRTNYWLTLHVLTIVAGYAAGTLAWGLGNLTLALLDYARGEIRLSGAVILDLGQDGFGASSRRGDGLLTIDLDGVRKAGGATFFGPDGNELSGRQVIRPGWSVRTEEGMVALTW